MSILEKLMGSPTIQRALNEVEQNADSERRAIGEQIAALRAELEGPERAKRDKARDAARARMDKAREALHDAERAYAAARHNAEAYIGERDRRIQRLQWQLRQNPPAALVEFRQWLLDEHARTLEIPPAGHDEETGKYVGGRASNPVVRRFSNGPSKARRLAALVAARQRVDRLMEEYVADVDAEIASIRASLPEVEVEFVNEGPLHWTPEFVPDPRDSRESRRATAAVD